MNAVPAAAQPPGVNHRRGQEALDRLGPRLPAVAARHNMATDRLRELFLADPYIAVDDSDDLLFIDEFLPENADAVEAGTAAAGAATINTANTFLLHSLPNATKVIYLDFDGHTTTGTSWNNGYGASIVSAPFSTDSDPAFSATELERIQYIWQRVAEDYLPYGVDVTTQDPGYEALRKYGNGDQQWGVRVVVSPTNWYNVKAGGVAYVGSFSWNTDTPCFVFTAQLGTGNEKYTAEAITHEAGHTVGLYHDGVVGGSAYYSGHNGWAPIMGVGYYQGLVQWSKGEYPKADNTEDDLAIMTGYGFGVRPDDHANTLDNATPLVVTNGTSVSGAGIIERPTDKDSFSLLTGAGNITLNVTGAPRSQNLDIKAELYDGGGLLVASADPSTDLNATITYTAAAGAYTLVIDGVGKGDLATGYSDYGSLGEYNIAGTIVDPGVAQPPVAVASATPTSGNVPLTVQFSGGNSYGQNGRTIESCAWTFGDGGAASGCDYTYTYYDKGTFTATLTVTDDAGWTGSANIVITVTGAPTAPTNLAAAAVSGSQINLTWADNSNDETGFTIERATVGGGWTPAGTVGANVTSYADTGLSAGTTYQYQVKATNAFGAGYSNTASATTQSSTSTPAVHIGDLDGTRSVSKRNWSAKVTILVHDASHTRVSGAVVTGSWSTGATVSCTTSSKGTCTVSASGIPLQTTSVVFAVSNVAKSGSSYNSGDNHDPDGETNGTTITIVNASTFGRGRTPAP